METSSTTNNGAPCAICGQETICGGLGVIRYDVPVGDPRFGKLFRCPNNTADRDTTWQERLRSIGNLDAFEKKTFDTFDTAAAMHNASELGSLQLALQVAQRFADDPQGWLLLEGAYGCGKTHLAAAIGNQRLKQGDAVLFITVPDLLDHLRASYGPSSEVGYDDTFDRLRQAPLLILDDLGVENPSAWAQEKLFQLFNYRYTYRLPTVVTTNADIDRLDGRIRSRLLDEELIRRVHISAPDYRSLVANQRRQIETSLHLYADMTFETFDIYSHVQPEEQRNLDKVLRAAYSYAQDPFNWLLLLGPYGSGKTHLAAAIAQHRRDQGEEVVFLTAPDLLDYLRASYGPTSEMGYDGTFNRIRTTRLLIIDDLGTENATPWAREKLFQLVDHRYVSQLPTVITTSRNLEEIDERIRVRLQDDRRCTIFAIRARAYVERRRRQQR